MDLQKFLAAPTDKMSSREIAQLTGKEHQHVLRDCDKLNENYIKLDLSTIGQTSYKDSANRDQRKFLLTKMQTMDLMTGYNIELRESSQRF
ncbi:Rha family transcriptional regulator [Epilithonimonas lactis]|uniref:Rha family transcriptional regulator n=1 Tax=Epilithonimonas lactis TaxID=421072 RepID=UPI00068CD603|nr:Rha family transcriptional regulator [Epilithonimonas lactis]SEQ07079.1 Phage regulatory protein Rha (Phage_pRha) [Epilithonimonas lactis]